MYCQWGLFRDITVFVQGFRNIMDPSSSSTVISVSSNISTTVDATKQKHVWLTFRFPYSAI